MFRTRAFLATLLVASSARAPLLTYASRSAMRFSRSALVAAAAGSVSANANSGAEATTKLLMMNATRASHSLFMTA